MIKIRNKRIALLLVFAMLATMFVGFGATASAATGTNGLLSISKSVNTNIAEDVADNLGYVKVAITAANAVAGAVYVEMTLPDDVEFVTGDKETFTTNDAVSTNTAFNLVLDSAVVPDVIVDSSAPDEINVDVTVKYLDSDNNEIDSYEGTLLLAKKADQGTTVTAASPKSVSMGYNKKIAKITLDEEIAGSLELGSRVVLELPDGFAWGDVNNADDDYDYVLTQGTYGLTATVTNGPAVSADYDKQQLVVDITAASSMADKFRFVAFITVKPDAPDGDVVVEVYDDSTTVDSNLSSTDITVATVGGAEVTVTAADTANTSDNVIRGSQDQETWEVTLETSAEFIEGDDLLLTLPDGVEFMESIEATNFPGFINNGLYDDNQGLWLTVAADTASDLVIDGEDLLIGLTPAAVLGDLTLTLGGDVVDATVVLTKIVDRMTVSAVKAPIKIGLSQLAGEVTITETKNKSFEEAAGKDTIFIKLPNGADFSSKPKVFVGDEEMDVTKVADDTMSFKLDELKTADKDVITIKEIKLDVDTRFIAGSAIDLSIGGIDAANDDVNRLDGTDGAQFEAEADDAMFKVAIATVGSATAKNATFTIGAASYVVDGATIAMDVAPFAENGRTYVPVRFIANALGVSDSNIYWDGVNQTVTLIKDNNVVQFKLGSTTRSINGINATMDVAPIAKDGRVFLPARFVAEAFGAVVGWDAAAPTLVTIAMP